MARRDTEIEVMATDSVVLDVRPFHERGEEPFDAIMQTVASLGPGQSFLLVNSFEPKPLIRVLGARGFECRCSEVASGEWHVLFTPRQP